MATRSRATRAMAGILDVHVHHASGLQSFKSYGEQDVYARFLFGELDPLSDAVLQTRTIRRGGNRPIFDQSLQIGVPDGENVLKCEVFMAQPRSRDVLLGSLRIPLDSIMMLKGNKQRKPVEHKLMSTSGDAPAGTLTLTLAYHGRQSGKLGCTRETSPVKGVKELSFSGASGVIPGFSLLGRPECQGENSPTKACVQNGRNGEMEGDSLPVGGLLGPKAAELPALLSRGNGQGHTLLGSLLAQFPALVPETQAVSTMVNSSSREPESASWQEVKPGFGLMLGTAGASLVSGPASSQQQGLSSPSRGTGGLSCRARSMDQHEEQQHQERECDGDGCGPATLMQLLPLAKCKPDADETCYDKEPAVVSRPNLQHGEDIEMSRSAFKPYYSLSIDPGTICRGLKRPRSASGLLDSPVSSVAGSTFPPMQSQARSVSSDPPSTALGLAPSSEGQGLGLGPQTLALQSLSGQQGKRLKGSNLADASTGAPAGELLSLLTASDKDTSCQPRDLPAFLSSRHVLGSGARRARVEKPAWAVPQLYPRMASFAGKLQEASGLQLAGRGGEDQVTPTSVLHQQISDCNSWQTEPALSEHGTTAESNSKSGPSGPVATTRVEPPVPPRGSDEGSQGLGIDLVFFSNGKVKWAHVGDKGKVYPVDSTPLPQPLQPPRAHREHVLQTLGRADNFQEFASMGATSSSGGSTGGETGRSAESLACGRTSMAGIAGGGAPGGSSEQTELPQADLWLKLPESERMLHQQAAAVWQASKLLAREESLLGPGTGSEFHAQVKTHQQAAAMWQASMGMSKEKAEAVWQEAIGRGTISRAQAAEFQKLWAAASHPQQLLQPRPLPFGGNPSDKWEVPEECDEQRRQAWKDFWDKLEGQRKEVAARGGPPRYGSRAFF